MSVPNLSVKRPAGELYRNPRSGQPDGPERRSNPRFKLSSGSGWIRTIPKYSLLDISASGVALKSDYPVRTGDLVRVSLRDGPSADALVVSCRLGRMPKLHLIPEFRLGCRFTTRHEGDRLFDRIEYQLASMMG